jgi:transcriptional regulator with XRE-family HTH domain
MALALRSVPVVPTAEEHAKRQRRQSWWLLVSRLASGTTQQAAAEAIGLSNASSYGDYERGVTPPSLRQLHNLAIVFGVDIDLLANPPETDEERWEQRIGRRSSRIDLEDLVERERRRAAG